MPNKDMTVVVELSPEVKAMIEGQLFPALEEVKRLKDENKRLREALTHLNFAASMNRDWDMNGKDDFAEAYPEQADWESGDVDEELCQALSHAEAALKVNS